MRVPVSATSAHSKGVDAMCDCKFQVVVYACIEMLALSVQGVTDLRKERIFGLLRMLQLPLLHPKSNWSYACINVGMYALAADVHGRQDNPRIQTPSPAVSDSKQVWVLRKNNNRLAEVT